MWLPTRSETNLIIQPPKMTRGLQSRNQEEEGLYYLCSENKGADQLRSLRAADPRLCIRKYIKQISS